jgi:hypothetical protein
MQILRDSHKNGRIHRLGDSQKAKIQSSMDSDKTQGRIQSLRDLYKSAGYGVPGIHTKARIQSLRNSQKSARFRDLGFTKKPGIRVLEIPTKRQDSESQRLAQMQHSESQRFTQKGVIHSLRNSRKRQMADSY